jgi:hypothetical protein
VTAVDPLWINSLTYDGIELRQAATLSVMHNGTALGARAGVLPGTGGLAVSVVGTAITVGSGVAWVYQSGQGMYAVPLTSGASLTMNAAHATLARIDLVYLRVWDNAVDASGLNKADAVYLAGTAASSPVAPTPAGTQIYIQLATISVPASGGGAASVSQTVMPKTVAPGGILPSSAAPTSPYTGQYYDDGTNLLRYNGSTWDTYVKTPGAWTSYTPTWTGSTTDPVVGNGTLLGYYSLVGKTCTVHIDLITGSTTTYGSGNWFFALPFAAVAGHGSRVGTAMTLGTGVGRYAGQCVVSPTATTTAPFFPDPAGDLQLFSARSDTPYAWTTNQQMRVDVTYEIA